MSQAATLTPQRPSPRAPQTTSRILLEFLGSMNLAVTLLVIVAIAAIIGTVLKQDQPYSDYLLRFGPYWFKVFRDLGLYDVYSATWFVFIMTFLVISTSVCVYRNGPRMLREMRQYRVKVQAKSLRLMRHHVEQETSVDAAGVAARARRLLENHGYRVREQDHGDHRVLAAMRGGFNRFGYLLTHIGIVVILVGGMLDSNMFLKMAVSLGKLKVETHDIPVSQVPASSRIGTWNPSYRGNVSIPEGSSANVLFLQLKDGYVVQQLPFTIAVKKFTVKHYVTGQPKDFESEVVVHDPRTGKTVHDVIRVNHPLDFDGDKIFQASFGDGGSKLQFKIWSLAGMSKPLDFKGTVFGKYALDTQDGKRQLEIDNFRMYNIEQVPGTDGETKPRDLGPSVTFKLRNTQGVANEYVNYLVPQKVDGTDYFLSGVRSEPNQPYRYLHVPMGPNGGVQRFMQLAEALHSPAILDDVAASMATTTLQAMGSGADAATHDKIEASIKRILQLFAKGGYPAVLDSVKERVPTDRQKEAADAFLKVLNAGLEGVYRRVLAKDGVSAPTQKDWDFFQAAVPTLSVLPLYGSPVYLQMTNFKQIQAAGLQITRYPGAKVVWIGALMLLAGIFVMFFVSHRRIWLRTEARGDGGTRVLFAGTSNRNMMEFDNHFAQLKDALFSKLRP
ncbi:cytochrome c biogenesis protein ResB [Acidihalobacter prosperus]|uniref:Cytochrome c-type biogenesis protein Ccs1/ResB n=1 Tax=Acidihalobacter prosperus TaxID=160660 RepID=A0A1A6C3S0_9GAMM|nr:cytochrome c biogenesis protein ResB [Acidihalobacter prosperus]OBS09204.1 Cytochrome c-type biogenesis protein Ccs1/ResB [Acidihalobacter prosperus]